MEKKREKQATSIRIDIEAKQEAEVILSQLGMNLSDAVNLFVHKIALEGGIPFDLKVTKKSEMPTEEK